MKRHERAGAYRLDLRGLLQNLHAEALAAAGDGACQSANASANDCDAEWTWGSFLDHGCFWAALQGGRKIGLGVYILILFKGWDRRTELFQWVPSVRCYPGGMVLVRKAAGFNLVLSPSSGLCEMHVSMWR